MIRVPVAVIPMYIVGSFFCSTIWDLWVDEKQRNDYNRVHILTSSRTEIEEVIGIPWFVQSSLIGLEIRKEDT